MSALISDHVPANFPTREEAQSIVDANTATETEGWSYRVYAGHNGTFRVEVKDETGFFVGFL